MDPVNITNGTWTPATSVTVKIGAEFLGWTTDANERIEDGEKKWNSLFTCTLVSFEGFEVVAFSPDDYVNPPPFHHRYWLVANPGTGPDGTPNGRTFSVIGFAGRTVGATTRINPDIAFNPASSDPSIFNYLGTHETGHTFNLDDCLATTTPAVCTAPGQSIMSGHASTAFNENGPTACDYNAVKNIYCPPTPSPSPTPTPTSEWPWPEIPTEPEPCQNGG
jgi:hypothetical protein